MVAQAGIFAPPTIQGFLQECRLLVIILIVTV